MMFNRIETIKDSLRSKIKQAEDVVFKELHTKDKYIEAFYIKSISDETILQDYMIKPFFKSPSPEHFLAYLQSQPKVKPFENELKTLDELIRGVTVLFYQDSIFMVNSKVDRNNSVLETTVETTIQSPQLNHI